MSRIIGQIYANTAKEALSKARDRVPVDIVVDKVRLSSLGAPRNTYNVYGHKRLF